MISTHHKSAGPIIDRQSSPIMKPSSVEGAGNNTLSYPSANLYYIHSPHVGRKQNLILSFSKPLLHTLYTCREETKPYLILQQTSTTYTVHMSGGNKTLSYPSANLYYIHCTHVGGKQNLILSFSKPLLHTLYTCRGETKPFLIRILYYCSFSLLSV